MTSHTGTREALWASADSDTDHMIEVHIRPVAGFPVAVLVCRAKQRATGGDAYKWVGRNEIGPASGN